MRRILVLSVLLALMLGTAKLGTDLPEASFTLAAIGFVLLAAFTAAELGGRIGLPKVTGYIVAGIILGPHATKILNQTVVENMQMFNSLAFGVIGLLAGLELNPQALKSIWRGLSATTVAKIPLLLIFVGGLFFLLDAQFDFLQLASSTERIVLALLFSGLAIGTSASVVLAVLSETRAKGVLASTILAGSVFKEVLLAIAVALSISVGKSLLDPQGQFDPAVFGRVAKEVILSIFAGCLVGGVLVLYLRYLRVAMILFVAAVTLLVTEISSVIHLEAIVVLITAGFVVRRFSAHHTLLLHTLELVSLPVFIIFFSDAGAGIDLSHAVTLLPLALALFFGRAFAYKMAMRFSLFFEREPLPAHRMSWLGYLPQAGVDLSMLIIAAKALPDLAAPIEALGMTVIALNMLAGPIAFRIALRRAGELPSAEVAPSKNIDSKPSKKGHRLRKLLPASAPAAPRPNPLNHLTDQRALTLLQSFPLTLTDTMSDFLNETIRPAIEVHAKSLRSWSSAADSTQGFLDNLQKWARSEKTRKELLLEDKHEELLSTFFTLFRALPESIEIAQEQLHLHAQPSDNWLHRWRKRLRKLGRILLFRAPPQRHVPIQLLFRIELEPQLVGFVTDTLDAWGRLRTRVSLQMRANLLNAGTAEQCVASIEILFHDFESETHRRLESLISECMVNCAQNLLDADTDCLPLSKMRYSRVLREVQHQRKRMLENEDAWETIINASHRSLLLQIEIARFRRLLESEIQDGILTSIKGLDEDIRRLERLGEDFFAPLERDLIDSSVPFEREDLMRDIHSMQERVGRESAKLQRLVERGLERPYSLHSLGIKFRDTISQTPEKLEIVEPPQDDGTLSLSTAVVWPVHLRSLFDHVLFDKVTPGIDEEVQSFARLIAKTGVVLGEVIDVIGFAAGLDADTPILSDSTIRDNLIAALERSRQQLLNHRQSLDESRDATIASVQKIIADSLEKIDTSISRKSIRRTAHGTMQGILYRIQPHMTTWYGKHRSQWQRLREYLSQPLGQIRSLNEKAEAIEELPVIARDAYRLRKFVRDHFSPAPQANIPPFLLKLFGDNPLRDRRFFVAHQQPLDMVVTLENEWRRGARASLLVLGRPGSGKTSFLDMIQLSLSTKRLIRLHDVHRWRREGPLRALANELGCLARKQEILHAIAQSRPVILIDDLEHWLPLERDNLNVCEDFIDIIIRSSVSAFWIASACDYSLKRWSSLLSVETIFTARATLPSMKVDDIRELIEIRARVSGLTFVYQEREFGRILDRLLRRDTEESFFASLAWASQGCPRYALSLWLQCLQMSPQANTVLVNKARLPGRYFRYIQYLPHTAIMILSLLQMHGPMTEMEITKALGVRRTELRAHLHFLRFAAHIEFLENDSQHFSVVPCIRRTLSDGLRSQRVT